MRLGFATTLAVSAVVVGGLILLMARDEATLGKESIEFFCAAGIRLPVEEVIDEYEEKYGVKILPQYKGSGELLGILRVAGGDVYLAADVTYMHQAREKGLLREFVPIASQNPVIAVPKGNPKGIQGLEDLLRDDVRLSLADPDRAAVSKVARKMLKQGGQWEPIWARVETQRGTVNEVANDVKMDFVDAGIIWDATAVQYSELDMIRVPEFDKKPKQICIGVLETSKQPARVLHFIRYLTARDKGLKNFEKHGYRIVKGDKWAEKPEIRVFCGGLNFPAIDETIKAFQEREGVTVLTTPAGCGTLVGQMKIGEHPDMYFACDLSYMGKVNDLFLDAVNVTRTDMVIITEKGNPHAIKTLADLASPGLKIALCDRQKSALGRLSYDLLEKNGLLEGVKKNEHATASTAPELVQNIVIGGLDAAIVYRANTSLQAGKLEIIAIDDPAAIAVQPIAVGRKSEYPHLTGRLMEQILSAESRERFEKLNFVWVAQP